MVFADGRIHFDGAMDLVSVVKQLAWRPTPFGEQADAELQASAALWRLNELLKEFVFCALFGVRLWSGYSCQSADFQRRDPSSEYSIHIPGAHTELIELAGKLQTPIVHDLLGPAIHLLVGRVSTESTSRIVVQFDVARASCACLHGRDAHATFSNCTTTLYLDLCVTQVELLVF